ncbi:MAG: two-component system response regulator [Betaproteobacteria bacterium]|jgi:FixJ family two-component response regulator|nr:two-component system response regulator [Betaproteobacteria bacterium]
MPGSGTVFVVDDDQSVREALSSLLRSVGLRVKTFPSAQEFIGHEPVETPACLVLDVRLPGVSGLDLQGELTRAGKDIPIIFMTAHGDIRMSVRAMKAGAMEFLSKPFRDQDLLDAIKKALVRSEDARVARARTADLRARYETLTSRQREVMAHVVAGRLNKQTASALRITEITVKVHRRHIMDKMLAKSVADLVRMAEKLG